MQVEGSMFRHDMIEARGRHIGILYALRLAPRPLGEGQGKGVKLVHASSD
jgi:hypothetical protein